MTLILTINGPETIWVLADRRLSISGRRPKDDAQKIMVLDTSDGAAILGYAGLGATAVGTEPANWMVSVLRGRNVPLEQSLSILAAAMKRQFPRHLLRFPASVRPAHSIFVPAFLDGTACLFSIDMAFAADRRSYRSQYTRHSVGRANGVPPRFAVAGSGFSYLNSDKAWTRDVIRLVKACDEKKISHNVVADHLATINYRVHKGLIDGSVGPRCIVVWRTREGHGGQRYYTATTLEPDEPMLPSISRGRDLGAFFAALMPHMLQGMPELAQGLEAPPLDVAAMNADLARLPGEPDEELR